MDYDRILEYAINESEAANSLWHGKTHWLSVRDNGIELAENTPGADITVVHLFGLLHDYKRAGDGKDEAHGNRAATSLFKIRYSLLKELSDRQFFVLQEAIGYHNKPSTSDDPTIGCCWDADRLDLPRVGINPSAKYLSTDYGKYLLSMRGLESRPLLR